MDFRGKTNSNTVMINTMTFRLPDGNEVIIDRDYTGYGIDKDGNLGMTWKGCYFWDGKEATYFTEDDEEKLAVAELVNVDIEDDAPEGYKVEIIEWD